MPRGQWTCQRQERGEKCGYVNANRYRKCQRCGKPRSAVSRSKPPAHMAALALPYEAFVDANGGDWCGICGKESTPMRKLDRDHSHTGNGTPRGLLCWVHNRGLQMFGDDPELLRSAIDYLERAPRGSGPT